MQSVPFNDFYEIRTMSTIQHALIACALFLTAGTALAGGHTPGSLLLFPEFDNRTANVTLVTVTNTNGSVANGTVEVEFVYIGKYDHTGAELPCLEFNRTHVLTPNDTLTVVTSAHNPQQQQGYLYVFAKDRVTHQPIVYNHLIGNVVTMQGIESVDFSMNPVSFVGIGNGVITDVDGDGNRDLDGTEYEGVPEEVYIPRFIGWNERLYRSELILVALSGGTAFTTIAGMWIYNDNEEAFSAQHSFRCWTRKSLRSLNGVFSQSFLASTNHAANEVLGYPSVETGWIRVYGQTAFSTAEQINDPALYAVLIEIVSGHGAADLPFESVELQANGALLPNSPFGDGDPVPVVGDNK
jgi:hypothetical protein